MTFEQCIQFACVTHSQGECIAWAQTRTRNHSNNLQKARWPIIHYIECLLDDVWAHSGIFARYKYIEKCEKKKRQKESATCMPTSWFVSIGVLASFPSFICCCAFFFLLSFRSFAISSANLEFASELSAISPHYTLTRLDCFVCAFLFSQLTACVSHTIELMSAMRVKSLLFCAVRCLPLFVLLLVVVVIWASCLLCLVFIWPLFMSHLDGENGLKWCVHNEPNE